MKAIRFILETVGYTAGVIAGLGVLAMAGWVVYQIAVRGVASLFASYM